MVRRSPETGKLAKERLKWSSVILFISWLFFSLSAYYVAQRPFSGQQLAVLAEKASSWPSFSFSATALLRSFLDIGAALWLAWIALGVGLWLLSWLALKSLSSLESVFLGLGLGFGSLGLMGLLLGAAGWLETAVFYTLAIILTLLTGKKILALLCRLHLAWPSPWIRLYLTLALGLALTLALLPPTSFDALLYHLKGPKLYLAAGQIQAYDIFHLYFPSLLEMVYMMAMALRGDVAAKLLHFFFQIMLAGLVYSMAQRHLRLKEGWTAVLLLYATPMVLTLAGWAYNDLGLAFYQVAALYALFHWQRTRQSGWLILSGILCGLAMGFKYTSFVIPLVLAGIVFWEYRQRLKRLARPLLQLTVSTAIVAAPMYVRNWLLTGNPVYPFLFNGRYWDAYRAAAYTESGTGIGFDLVAILRVPYDFTLGIKDVSQDGLTGPLFLAFLPLILIYGLSRWRKRAPAPFGYLLLFALAQYAFWLIGVISTRGLWQSRLLLSCLAALIPVLAWILSDLGRIDHPQFSLHRFLRLVIGLVLILNLAGQLSNWLPRAPWLYLAGTETRDDYLRRELGAHYAAMTAVNEQLPAGAVVEFLFEPRSYYCERVCQPDDDLDKWGHLIYLHGDAGSIVNAWRKAGVTHVLLYQTGIAFIAEVREGTADPVNTAVLQALQDHYFQPVADIAGVYTLYQIIP